MTVGTMRSRSLSNRAAYGIFLMIIGLALYPLSDAFIKNLTTHYSVVQVTFLRALGRLIPLLVILLYQVKPIQILKTTQIPRHLIRLAINFVFTFTFMFAYSWKSLTDVYTLSFTSSFFMIALGAIVLKENVGIKKWMAVIVGMIGVLIATQPNHSNMGWVSFLILFGTFLGALNRIFMRKLATTEHSLSITIYPNVMMILLTFPLLISQWKAMPLNHWALFLLMGLIAAAGQYAIAQSLRYAETSILAPIDYSTLFWAVFLDYVWWNVIPSHSTLIGATIIVGSNLYILYFAKERERTC